jgi:hypothetical protein
MLNRVVTVAAMLAVAVLVSGQEVSPGWTRAVSPDGKSWVWTLADTSARGAAFEFRCDESRLAIRTRESLLELADPDDFKIRIGLLSLRNKRFSVDGYMTGDYHGVIFEGDERDLLEDQLRSTFREESFTLILSNSGKRDVYTFVNRNTVPGVDALDCEMKKAKSS